MTYSLYRDAVSKFVPWLKEQINKSPDKTIRIETEIFKKRMGPDFEIKNNILIHWGLKYALIRQDIYVGSGQSKIGEDLLIMRMATPKDWRLAAKVTAEKIAGHPLLESEFENIVGRNPEDWRRFIMENY